MSQAGAASLLLLVGDLGKTTLHLSTCTPSVFLIYLEEMLIPSSPAKLSWLAVLFTRDLGSMREPPSTAGYECLCGFKSTRATNFLRHIKENAASGEIHRLVEADAVRSFHPVLTSTLSRRLSQYSRYRIPFASTAISVTLICAPCFPIPCPRKR